MLRRKSPGRLTILVTILLLVCGGVLDGHVPAQPSPTASHVPPSETKTGEDIPLVVNIEAPSNVIVLSVTVYWGTAPESTTSQVSLAPQNSTVWSGAIPEQSNSGTVFYFIKVDYLYTTTGSSYLPDESHRYSVTVKGSAFSNFTLSGLVIGGALLIVAVLVIVYAYRRAVVLSERSNESEYQRTMRRDYEEGGSDAEEATGGEPNDYANGEGHAAGEKKEGDGASGTPPAS